MTATPISPEAKNEVSENLRSLNDVDEQLKLCAQLKVYLLADYRNGGLSEESRRRAWDMVAELTKLIMAMAERR